MVSANSSKKRTENSYIVLLGKKTNSFVRFLEESSAWKNHFEFVWPLSGYPVITFVRVIYAWLDGYKSFLSFYALFFLNILMLCNRYDFYQFCKTDNFIISDKNRWFIACKSDTAGLLKTWFSVKNLTENSRLFYHFNGSKIGSIHTPTACLLSGEFWVSQPK